MLLSHVFERFVEKTPFAVMARSMLERTLVPEALDALFKDKAESQYLRELAFSSVVDLMGQVVTSAFPSVRAAFLSKSFGIPVSLTSLYNKLQGIEPVVAAELVIPSAKPFGNRRTSTRGSNAVRRRGAEAAGPLAGQRGRGNRWAGVSRRGRGNNPGSGRRSGPPARAEAGDARAWRVRAALRRRAWLAQAAGAEAGA